MCAWLHHLHDCLSRAAAFALVQRGGDYCGGGRGPGVASGLRGDQLQGKGGGRVAQLGQEDVEIVDLGGGGEEKEGEQQECDFNSVHHHL